MSAVPRPTKSGPASVAMKGSDSHCAASPGGTTSVCPAKTNSGPDAPCVAQKLSTAPKRRDSTANPACCKRAIINGWQPASSGVTEAQAIKSRVSASVGSWWSVVGMQHLVEFDRAFVGQALHGTGARMSPK